jgi:RND family efflux transporter MFP subunit
MSQQNLTTTTLGRYRALLDRHSIAPQEYDEVAARARVAAAELQRAEAMITAITAKKRQVMAKVRQAKAESTSSGVLASYATITAPFDGIVIAKPAEIGMLASPSVPLLEVEAQQYFLEVAVAESATQHLLVGQKAQVTLATATQPSTQPIREIVPTADPASHTVLVKIALPITPGLRSGLYGRATFTVGRRAAVVVPRHVLTTRGQLQGVYILTSQDTASLRFVKAGRTSADLVEILAGLTAGERVIVPSSGKIVEGLPVIPHVRGANAG